MLKQVADGVWVRQSAWVWSNATAVRGEGGLVLVDPGIDDPILTPDHRRPAWRPHLAAHRTNRLLALPGTHGATPPDRGVATTS